MEREQAASMVEKILRTPMLGVLEIIPVGSYRRGKAELGDLDFLVVSNTPATAMADFAKGAALDKVDRIGQKLVAGAIGDAVINAWLVEEPAYLGAFLLHATGSGDFNIMLRLRAKRRGGKLNQYGLWENGKRVAGATEASIFAALGMPYMPPNEREIPKARVSNVVLDGMLRIATLYDHLNEPFKARAFRTATIHIRTFLNQPARWPDRLGPSTLHDAMELMNTGSCERLRRLEAGND